MADLKLKRVVIRNWMKLGNIDVEFPDHGLVMVAGINSASNGAMLSVGSGKTGLGEAVSRTLLGVPGRFTHLRQFSRDKQGDTYVRVESTLFDKPLVVESGYKCDELSKTGEALRFHYDGKTIERGLIQQTRDELIRLIGVPPLLAAWSVFVDGDNLKFNKMGQAQCVELVMTALRQPPWGEYYEHSKKTVGKYRQVLAKDEKAHEDAQLRVSETEEDHLDAKDTVAREQKDFNARTTARQGLIDAKQKTINQHIQAVDEAKQELVGIAAQIQRLEETNATEYHQLEIKRNELNECIQTLSRLQRQRLEQREDAAEIATPAKNRYESYRDSAKDRVCQACGQAIVTQIDESKLETLRQKHEQTASALDAIKARYAETEASLDEKREDLQKLQDKIDALSVEKEVTALSRNYEKIEKGVAALLTRQHQEELLLEQLRAGVPRDKLDGAVATEAERLRVWEKAKETAKETASQLTSSLASMRVLDYWNASFSPYGIPNMVLKDAIGPLNKEARRVSALMTGGTIEIRYGTQRELASGADKAELVIEVDNKLGSQDLLGNSKGEGGLTNLIIAETLCEVGQIARRVGYRWYDEVVPHQDPVVCKTIYSRLRDIAHQLGILIFLVDHNPVAADYADYTLVVEKSLRDGQVIGDVYWR